MFEVASNKITISRGDNARCELFINEGTNGDPILYDIKESDVFKMFLFPVCMDIEDAIWCKELDSSDLTEEGLLRISFIYGDTADLPKGEYSYKILLYRENTIDTVIGESSFVIV